MFKDSKRFAVLGLLILTLSAAPVHAVEQGGYIGIAFGDADDDILSETDSGIKIYGGFNLSENLGLEMAYVDLGEYANNTLEQDGVAFSIVGYLPVTDSFDFFGKFGMFAWEVRRYPWIDTGNDLTYGFGGEVRLSEQAAIRAEWEIFKDVSGGDVELISLGVSIRF